jgi:hypothetical protein
MCPARSIDARTYTSVYGYARFRRLKILTRIDFRCIPIVVSASDPFEDLRTQMEKNMDLNEQLKRMA